VNKKSDPLADRKKLSFEQAEGLAPLPTQLKRGEISKEFRAILWAELHRAFEAHRVDVIDSVRTGKSVGTDPSRCARVSRSPSITEAGDDARYFSVYSARGGLAGGGDVHQPEPKRIDVLASRRKDGIRNGNERSHAAQHERSQ
jgi:hypothetical protein